LMLVGEVTEETLVEEEPHACKATSASPGVARRRIRLRNRAASETVRLMPIRNGTQSKSSPVLPDCSCCGNQQNCE
jgi:hypothetical protein